VFLVEVVAAAAEADELLSKEGEEKVQR